MFLSLTKRFLTEPDPRLLAKFVYTFGLKGARAVGRFNQRVRLGKPAFPAFVFISVTDQCNLRCQGCWVSGGTPPRRLSLPDLERIVAAGRSYGSSFFGLLGGEPLMHPEVFDLIARHPECYFQVFTNGTLLSDDVARRMRQLGNVTPLISIEGNADVSDQRRGGTRVHERALEALENCRRHRLITGVASSICRSNFKDLVDESFVRDLIRLRVLYLWYYIYRPAGPQPHPELALDREEILRLREFLVELRTRAPMLLIDAYWDHLGRAMCPAAVGISHHVGPGGDIEPCPPIQFARDTISGDGDLGSRIAESEFLAAFRRTAQHCTRGCILLEHPEVLGRFLQTAEARDSSGRGRGLEELAARTPLPGHHLPGREIPERHWLYRLSKKYWFFGFGAYG